MADSDSSIVGEYLNDNTAHLPWPVDPDYGEQSHVEAFLRSQFRRGRTFIC
jgi:hypothetical protein